MIVVMQIGASQKEITAAEERLKELGYKVFKSGEIHTVLGAVGIPTKEFDVRDIERLAGVGEVIKIAKPFKLVNRAFRPEGSIIDAGGVKIGGDEFVVIAGPCAVESREQIRAAAAAVKAAGARILRGGAFKPRTSPYVFQGLGEEGLKYLREAADEQGMPCVTEVLDTVDVELVDSYADLLQVGARNMQNFRLLGKLGKAKKPVLLKRGISATLEELLMAAEYIVSSGNPKVVLCERGIRTFEPWTRNTLDLSAIPVLRKMTHLPIIVDPSHATGVREYVIPMGRAGMAAGADGIIVEVHPDPDKAKCDGAQSLPPEDFKSLMSDLRIMAPAVRKHISAVAGFSKRKKLQKPLFKEAVIVGVGLIGGSLALALKESGAVEKITGVGRDGRLDAIVASGVADIVLPVSRIAEAVKNADLVILASPVLNIMSTLNSIGPMLKKGALVTDAGSTKSEICFSSRHLPKSVYFIGGHPMAGSERRGPGSANPLLFEDAVYILCPNEGTPPDLIESLKKAVSAIGAHPLEMDPERHDRLVAAISHVPHLVAAALSNSAGRLNDDDNMTLRLAAGGFRDTTRTASSPAAIWGDVLATNSDMVKERLSAFRAALDRIEAGFDDPDRLEKELDRAARYRSSIPRNIPGIQSPDTDLMVRIPNEPGSLASVTTSLAREKINICDIQVMKVRQDEDGVLRLAFIDKGETERAAEVLRRSGHEVHIRRE